MRVTGLGVSPGIGIGKALVLKRGARDLRFRILPAASRASWSGSPKRAADPASSCSRSASASPRRPAPNTPTCSMLNC